MTTFSVSDDGDGGLVQIELSGRIDAASMREGLARFVEIAERYERLDCLYRIAAVDLPTLGAIEVELRQLGRLLPILRKLRRCAVLSDQAWVRTAARVEGALVPGLAIRVFDLRDEQGARDWIAAAS